MFTPILGRKSVIPKGLRESLKLKKGDTLEAKVDELGFLSTLRNRTIPAFTQIIRNHIWYILPGLMLI